MSRRLAPAAAMAMTIFLPQRRSVSFTRSRLEPGSPAARRGGAVTARGYDLAIVGAGIVGLAHALAAVRLGKRVVVIDRDAQANGASIRNFGFITVTGQQAGDCWRRALRSRDVWVEIAPRRASTSCKTGSSSWPSAPRRWRCSMPFIKPRWVMAASCWGRPRRASGARCWPQGNCPVPCGVPASAGWNRARPYRSWHGGSRARIGVTFIRHAQVSAVEPGLLETSVGTCEADACVVCPGDDFTGLFADRLAAYDLTRCKLQMLRIAAPEPDWHVPGAIMSDLGSCAISATPSSRQRPRSRPSRD